MLWEAPPWLELVLNAKLPEEDLADPHAGSKEFAEDPSLRRPRPNATRDVFWMSRVPFSVLYVPVGSMEEYEYARQKNSFELYLPFEPYVETFTSLYSRFIEELNTRKR